MFKKEWQKTLIIVGVLLLFILIILTAYHFVKEPEDVNIVEPTQEPEKPTEVFQNFTDLSESDIKEMAEEKRIQLQAYLAVVPTYKVSEAFEGYSPEDDEVYMGIGQSFLDGLHDLITDDFFNQIMDQLEMGEVPPTVGAIEPIYIARVDLFDKYYLASAISQQDYNQEVLILKEANDIRINMVENLRYCNEENPDICIRDDFYDYVLKKENEEYKIDKIR